MMITTGIPVLDGVLDGGFPENRTVLLIGGPGAGKSTLAMQFLQAGLDRDEACLYVSTEQTTAELRDSFAPFAFDLDHDRLSIATIHAKPGYTIESDEEVLTLESLEEDEQMLGDGGPMFTDGELGGFSAPFSSQYIRQFLQRYRPCDRVVFDSVSGLAAIAETEQRYRRAILDLIRLFTDEFEATTLFTAEENSGAASGSVAASDLLQYNAHGSIRLWNETVDGDYHRFVQVMKMRGVNHETKALEVEFDREGVHAVPLHRTRADSFAQHDLLNTGISGLDRLIGEGIIKGGTLLLEHDGRADVDIVVTNAIIEAVRNDQAVVLLPPASMDPERLESMVGERVGSVKSLLEDNRLFILDLVGNWRGYGPNVYTLKKSERVVKQVFGIPKPLLFWKMRSIFSKMNEGRGDQSAVAVVYTEAMLQEFRPNEVRQMYYWARENLFVPDDTVVFVQNPGVMQETLAEFFVYDAEQMLRTWMHDNGLQYLKLEKSPIGHLGSTQLVEHVDYPPYIRVQRPRERRTEL